MKAGESAWNDILGRMAVQAGACAWGSCNRVDMDGEVVAFMDGWVKAHRHAGMDYLERHVHLKPTLHSVLPGCNTVISFAFPYFTAAEPPAGALRFSRHALGDDYHKVLRTRLKPILEYITSTFGGSARICVDSAPVAERYWAVKCGLGSIGRNGLLYVPGYGSWVFLAEILATATLPAVSSENESFVLERCEGCSRCIDACPGHAIGPDRTVDSSRCRAYLTIECRDERLPQGVSLGKRVYGCDVCQEVCPANSEARLTGSVFTPRKELLELTAAQLETMTDHEYSRLVKGTSVERATLSQLKRNTGLTGYHNPLIPS